MKLCFGFVVLTVAGLTQFCDVLAFMVVLLAMLFVSLFFFEIKHPHIAFGADKLSVFILHMLQKFIFVIPITIYFRLRSFIGLLHAIPTGVLFVLHDCVNNESFKRREPCFAISAEPFVFLQRKMHGIDV